MDTIDGYLKYLQDQGPPGGPSGGPPAKLIQLKSSGAEQDDEEPPTTARTKRFEKDEAKISEFDIVGTAAQIATSPRAWTQVGVSAATYATVGALQKKKRREMCAKKYPNNPQAATICAKGGKS
jgi:hypothetical protein